MYRQSRRGWPAALFLRGVHGSAGLQVVKGDDFRADKAALDVGMDLPGCFRRFCARLCSARLPKTK